MALDYINNAEPDSGIYKGKIDESINLLRKPPVSTTKAAGVAGVDYEVADWAPLTLTADLVYYFKAHVANAGACNITHGAVVYDIKLLDGNDPQAGHIPAGGICKVLLDSGGDLVLLNPADTSMDWCGAAQVGNGLAISVGTPAIAAMTSTRIAKTDSANDTLAAYDWDGTDWTLVGSALALTGFSGNPALAALNSTDVAFIDATNDELRTYRFNGSTWVQVGNSLAIASAGNPALAALNATDVAFIDGSNDQLRTYRFDGTDWVQVGSGLAISSIGNPALAALNSTDVALISTILLELRVYRWDGSDWSQVGNGLAISGIASPALTAINSTDVVFADENFDDLRLYRWDGSDFTAVGHPVRVTISDISAIAHLSDGDIAYIDGVSDELRTYRWTKKLGSHGWYDGTLTGLTTSPTVRIHYSVLGDVVTLVTDDATTGTSNANTFKISGAPAAITPAVESGWGACVLTDNGAAIAGMVFMDTVSQLQFLNGVAATGFTSSGTKGIPTNRRIMLTYKLTNP